MHPILRVHEARELAAIAAAEDDRETTRRCAREALSVAEDSGLRWLAACARLDLAEAVDAAEEAVREARAAAALAEQMGAVLVQARGLACVAARADTEEAGASLQAAAAILTDLGRRLGPLERLFLRTPLCRRVLGGPDSSHLAELPTEESSGVRTT